MLPDVAVTSVFFGQCHGIGHMADTGIIGSQYELGLFFLIRDFTKRTLHSGNILHGSFDTLFRSCSLPGGTPMARAVAGISCISPLAPAHDTTFGLKFDSV